MCNSCAGVLLLTPAGHEHQQADRDPGQGLCCRHGVRGSVTLHKQGRLTGACRQTSTGASNKQCTVATDLQPLIDEVCRQSRVVPVGL